MLKVVRMENTGLECEAEYKTIPLFSKEEEKEELKRREERREAELGRKTGK